MKPGRLEYPPARLRALRTAFGSLTDASTFTTWRFVERDGKWSKVPTHPAGTPGVTFAEAVRRFEADGNLAGLGVKLGRVPGTTAVLFGIDYDGAAKAPLPQGWPETTTYTERSPSGGDKFHVLGLYEGEPFEGKRKGAVEVYSEGRFFTLTGDRINGAEVLPTDPRPYYAAIGVPDPQPYVAAQVSSGARIGPLMESDLTERECRFLEAVRGIEDADPSRRDFKVCIELVKRGAGDDEISRVLRVGFWREKQRGHRSYVKRTIKAAREAACKDGGPALATGNVAAAAAAMGFRDESKVIGEGTWADNYPAQYDLAAMLAEAVFIKEGSQVALRSDPRSAWSLADFENAMAASLAPTKGRPAAVAKLWLRHPKRVTVDTRTFQAGGPLFCQSPDDRKAINTWREPPRVPPPKDWRERAKPFIEHVTFLVPVVTERGFLLDWLAHIEQHPGVLPHVHVLMYTPKQGIGRNWLASVLARVWPGVTALDVDLPALLDGKFNGRLSRKVFAVVNEIREGGGSNVYRHADRLRTLLTDEWRRINPKFGREYDEFNAVRWLMFSNHESALPLDRFDRRVYAIANPEDPRSQDYYGRLYAMAGDGRFIASVREALRVRDISKFNPGMHAPLTETKMKVIAASMSDAELEMQDIAENYPGDCITSGRLSYSVFGAESQGNDRKALRHIAPRAGSRKYRERVRIHGVKNYVWILRNHLTWLSATPYAVLKEVERGEEAEQKRAIEAMKGKEASHDD